MCLRPSRGSTRARLWGVGIVLPGPFGAVAESERDPLAMPNGRAPRFVTRFSEALSLPSLSATTRRPRRSASTWMASRAICAPSSIYTGRRHRRRALRRGAAGDRRLGNAGEMGRMPSVPAGNGRESQGGVGGRCVGSAPSLTFRAGGPPRRTPHTLDAEGSPRRVASVWTHGWREPLGACAWPSRPSKTFWIRRPS